MKKTMGSRILLLMIGIYLLAIAWINFSETPGFYDADMYADVLYAVKAWEAKSIFPENWVFGNQLNVVAAPVLAALIYGICPEPFLAMGCASTVMALLLLASMNWMMKPVLPERNPRLVSILTFMSVMLFYNEAVDGLKGWQLFFTMCAYYAGYGITLFLAFGCYLRAAGREPKRLWGMVVLTCILSFGTGMQSVRQTLVMAVPLAGVEFLRLLSAKVKHRHVSKIPLAVAAAISISNVAGVFTQSQMEIRQISNLGAIELTPVSGLPGAAVNAAVTIYSMFVNYDPVSFILLGILGLLYAAGIYACIHQAIQKKDWMRPMLILLLAAAVCAIGAVDVLTTMDVAARYYFPVYPLVGILVACLYDVGAEKIKASILALLVVIFGLSCTRELLPVVQRAASTDSDYVYEVSDYLVENGYTHACSLWYSGTRLVVASGGEIEGVFRYDEDRPFSTSGFLLDATVTSVEPQRCIYIFYGKEDAADAVEAAREKGVELDMAAYFEECDWYLYTAPVNLLAVFS